ncbi:MAG: LysM peptidoglycan-binding domain-containing protein [Victivallales bacterium]|nr:LysM peptidoglycan-binding domain-containing protein [Victivallales bacterium]
MKRLFDFRIVAALVIVSFAGGCRAKLAESPYGAREQAWEGFIKETYPYWEPPRTVPPETSDPALVRPETFITVMEDDVVVLDPATAPGLTPALTLYPVAVEQTYKVQKGDTLWKISRDFYGSGKEWRRIFEHNQDVLSNPDKLREGSVLKIPAAR